MKALLTLFAAFGIVAAWHYLSADRAAVNPTPVAAEVAPLHRLSADDVFYLREYASIRTAHGLAGWAPGQRLELAPSAAPVAGKIIVTDGTNLAALDPAILTHDMDEAQALLSGDQQSEAAQATQAAQAKTILAQQQLIQQMEAARDNDMAAAQQAAGNTVGSSASRLGDAASYHGSVNGSVYYYPVPVYYNSPGSRAGASSSSSALPMQPAAMGVMSSPVNRYTTAPRPQAPTMSSLPMRPGTNPGPGNGLRGVGQ